MAAEDHQKDLVFVVEDDPTWATTLKAKLSKRYEVQHFTSGEAAVEKIDQAPHIVVLDYHLEGQWTGFDTLKQIRKRQPEALVIMLSAQESVQTAVDIMDHGAYDYIVKGEHSLERLRILLRNIEERHKLKSDFVDLKIRVKRERLALGFLVGAIALISILIFLNICPSQRYLKWDPFNIQNSANCRPGNIPPPGGIL